MKESGERERDTCTSFHLLGWGVSLWNVVRNNNIVVCFIGMALYHFSLLDG